MIKVCEACNGPVERIGGDFVCQNCGHTTMAPTLGSQQQSLFDENTPEEQEQIIKTVDVFNKIMNDSHISFIVGVKIAVAFLGNVLYVWRDIKKEEIDDAATDEKDIETYMQSIHVSQLIQIIMMLMNDASDEVIDEVIEQLQIIKEKSREYRKKKKE